MLCCFAVALKLLIRCLRVDDFTIMKWWRWGDMTVSMAFRARLAIEYTGLKLDAAYEPIGRMRPSSLTMVYRCGRVDVFLTERGNQEDLKFDFSDFMIDVEVVVGGRSLKC